MQSNNEFTFCFIAFCVDCVWNWSHIFMHILDNKHSLAFKIFSPNICKPFSGQLRQKAGKMRFIASLDFRLTEASHFYTLKSSWNILLKTHTHTPSTLRKLKKFFNCLLFTYFSILVIAFIFQRFIDIFWSISFYFKEKYMKIILQFWNLTHFSFAPTTNRVRALQNMAHKMHNYCNKANSTKPTPSGNENNKAKWKLYCHLMSI